MITNQIEFKVWCLKTKKFINVDTMQFSNEWNILSLVATSGNHYLFEDYSLLQYIRKNDRMNTKIYVWDIIKNWFAWVRVVQECSWWFELLWIDWEYKDSNYTISALNSECTVFGNIYENPEILEEYNKIPKVKYDTDYLFPNKW